MKRLRHALVALLVAFVWAASAASAPIPLKVRWAPSGIAPPTIPLVAPSGSWNGTAGTGGTPPTDATRTTAKPTVQFWTVPFQNLAANQVIGVTADAGGTNAGSITGVTYVDFWVEGTVQRVTTPSLYSYVGGNGQTISRWGYWINLNIAAANAAHPNGAIDIYATACPNDVTMQCRTIGGVGPVNGTTGTINSTNLGDATLRYQRHFNWSSKYDLTATLCPSGCTYTTLDAALTGIRTAAATHPRVLCKTTGDYELTNRTLYYDAGTHWTDVAADPGVTCTFGRATTYNIADEDSWLWKPQYDWLHFKGPGAEGDGNIVINQYNFSQMETFGNRPYWFDGITVTNTTGTRDNYRWNMGGDQAIGPYYASYWTDNTFSYMASPFQYQKLVTGNAAQQGFTEYFSMTPLVAHNYLKDYNADFFHDAKSLFSLTYTGGASPVTFTSNFGYPATADLNCGGVHTILTNTRYASQETGNNVFYLTTAKTKWETACPGLTMTILEPLRSTYWWDATVLTNIKSPAPTLTVTGHWELHADWFHSLGSPENVTVINNVTLPPIVVFGMMNNECTLCKDYTVKNNTWGTGFFGTFLGSNIMSHYVMANNTFDAQVLVIPTTPSDVYSSLYGNVTGVLTLSSGSSWPASFTAHKNLWLTGGPAGALTAYPDNFTPIASQSGLFVNATNPTYDYTPTGSLVSTYTATPSAPRDWRQLLRATVDAIGAWAIGGSTPVYP